MSEFKVKASFPYVGWIISKVYGVDHNKERFLLMDYDGRFIYVNIDDCTIVENTEEDCDE